MLNLGTNNTMATGYGSLWYVLPTGSAATSQPGQFRVVQYLSTTETPAPNWVLIGVAFTDAGQQVIRWQAGSVVLPIPDSGQQIQWGGTLQQLGRGCFQDNAGRRHRQRDRAGRPIGHQHLTGSPRGNMPVIER